MYLDSLVKIPEARGKITFRTKGKTTYVEYESDRVYVPEKKYTTVSRKTIGKLTDTDRQVMQPNENFLKFFPDTILPEEKDRALRSCALRIGTWIVIRKIVNDYKLSEILGRYLAEKDVGLLLDLCAYSIIEEDNRAQHYPSYAYSHPLFTEGMKIYSDSKVSDFLQSMDREVSVAFQNDWNRERNHREKIYISYDSTSKHCEAGDLRIVEMGHSKENEETNIFNYAIAYDTENREPLFYELYPGSINDISQLQCTVDKAKGYGYKKIGFVLDRGYFSKDNIYYLEENGYSFIMMLKGKADLVQKWILENKGSFETSRACNIPAYQIYGKTIEKKLFASDKKPRFIHLYHSIDLLKGTIDLAIADFPENLPGISLTDLYREENVLVIEKGLFAKRFTYSAEECKRHLLAGDYSALKECPFVLGGIEDIDGRISRDILRRAGVDKPIVTAASHNVGMLLRLSLYGVGACVCPQKIVQSVLTPQQMESVWLFPLGAETVGCIQFGYQAQSYQWSVIEEFILCAKAVVC